MSHHPAWQRPEAGAQYQKPPAIGIRLPRELTAWMRAEAGRRGTSVAAVIVDALRRVSGVPDARAEAALLAAAEQTKQPKRRARGLKKPPLGKRPRRLEPIAPAADVDRPWPKDGHPTVSTGYPRDIET